MFSVRSLLRLMPLGRPSMPTQPPCTPLAPTPNSTIMIFARITKDLEGVRGATATAVVHFQGGDQTLDQHPASDSGGYASFKLALQGRQPDKIPVTVDVIFTNFPGGTLPC